MNERERLMAVLEGRVPDRTPWFADMSYLYSGLELQGKLDSKYQGDEGYIRFHKDLGVGAFCYYPVSLWKTEYAADISYLVSEKDGYRIHEYATPLGKLRSMEKYLPNAYTWAYCEHFVKTIEDLRIMLYIFENSQYSEGFDYFNEIDALWGGDGMLAGIAPVSVSALQKLIARWAGLENTVDIVLSNREEFEEIILRIHNSEDSIFEILKRSPALYIEFPENLSSEVTGKYFFEKYNAPYYQKRTSQLHAAGKYTGLHIDGTLKPCLSMLKSCGFDVAESVTPYPVGDVAPEGLREIAGSGITIWGGLPGALFSRVYTDYQFDEHLKKVLDTFPLGSGFVLGVADQVPPDAVIDRVIRVREQVER